MDNNPYIFITNGACLVVDNTAANGIITQNPAGAGNIVTEAENNRVVWKINTGTGNYVVPFTYSGTKIPLTFNIGTAGAGAGSVIFSTYHTVASNNLPYATYDGTNTIPNVNDQHGFDNSSKILDRWWIIDAGSYGTKPAATITFTYINAEWAASSNIITEGNLQAQPFDSNLILWDPAMLYGSDAGLGGATGNVSGATVPVANLFRTWVLVDKDIPLPVELLSFTATCRNEEVVLNWSTASETNNDFFTIEKSNDAVTWTILTTVTGAGYSNSLNYYSALDDQPYAGITYYRLKQTDFDGTYTYSQEVSTSCDENSPFTVQVLNLNISHELQLIFSAEEGEQYIFSLYDMQGKLLMNKSTIAISGTNEIHISLDDISEGIYLIALQNSEKFFGQKILLK
jgi:hypothetical protein